MSPSALAALALFAFLHPHSQASSDQAYELGRWRLDVHHDAFRKQVRCRIVDDYGHFPRIVATPGALILKLPGHADGSQAWFSVDGAPATPWRDVEAALIADGAMAEAESLDNTTGGMLPLPYTAIGHARTVRVQSKQGDSPFSVDFRGLWRMLASAEQLGCRF